MPKSKYSKEEKKFFHEIFWNSFILENSYNYESQQSLGFALGMWPAIKRFYQTKEEQAQALVRHLEIFNTTPHLVPAITGVTAALEKKASTDPDFQVETINNIKVSLMGPFAGIGDSFFWGTLRIIATALALPLAKQGNILGPILFLLAFNIPHLIIRYYAGVWGYSLGTNLLTSISSSGLFAKISKAATIVGLMVIGAMSAQMVLLKTPLAFHFGKTSFKLQTYLDQIFPLLLPLGYTLLMFWLLKSKKKSPLFVLLLTVAIGLMGSFIGIF
ncbi:PTS system mannose/fructose/sorbose family transporter subunit IID [Lactobacillus sp. DCY120]|uniref:PTS system mannose/fructose/sorbose family transporter subunit IID n=1 Tax=Bombilactobacillus apium TaxID=2675299 RepID=A0A850R0C7_9LACO|nr:PTS system mannose/fructose/sorbose family transporter subunit IID [Bombilactobacillus apium]NVY96383.1 PTS system mannose/fructose/sorbose family transporter subunit IID [Bombilactobacillus apium]